MSGTKLIIVATPFSLANEHLNYASECYTTRKQLKPAALW